MDGWPVWLASLSRRDRRGRILGTARWSPEDFADAEAQLDYLLDGLGDPGRQRSFRMNVTLCRHRALTEEEHAALPDAWHDEPAVDIAGGPLEVRWFDGIPETTSTLPCERPERVPIDSRDRSLWFPMDCGECESCRARAEVRTGVCACRA